MPNGDGFDRPTPREVIETLRPPFDPPRDDVGEAFERPIPGTERETFFPGPVPFPDVVPIDIPAPFPAPVSSAPAAIGSIILRGGIVGVLGKLAIDILIELGQQRLDRELEELEAELETARRRTARLARERPPLTLPPLPQFEEPDRDLVILPRPQVSPKLPDAPLPQPVEIPSAPVRVPVPAPPAPVVSPQPLEIPSPTLPAPSTAPVPRTVPTAPTRPAPVRFPLPTTIPFPFPFPSPLPTPRPTRVPIRESIPDLTRIDPIVRPLVPSPVALPSVAPFAQSQVPPSTQQKECVEVKRRRRRKNVCREGFFREFPGKTRFITWREVDCLTGKEIKIPR